MNKKAFENYVKAFDFKGLFIDLGWDHYGDKIPVAIDEKTVFELRGIAEKRGFVIVLCPPGADGNIPLSSVRKKIEHCFAALHHEHLILYEDAGKTKQVWQYAIHEPDKPRKTREILYSAEKDPEILYQRARGLLFTLDEEENITLADVIGRFRENFAQNAEQVTKRFYTEFKKHHQNFLGFISGIDDAVADKDNKNKQWYASLMLNRLMFCYFIQKKGYLDRNVHYLQDKLKQVKANAGKDKFYSFYRGFLLVLFHKGLGLPADRRNLSDLPADLGRIPYLNGGLFDVHELESEFADIQIKDEAFETIFNFFDQWNWHLDIRAEAAGRDINPDVIGYIFEKYINDRAAMGAYYTKEDITDYIAKNTILPFVFDRVKTRYPNAFKPGGRIWSFLKESRDAYIYDAVKKGVPKDGDLFGDLPADIRAGFLPEFEKQAVADSDSPHLWEIRKCWNQRAPEDIALPAETYRELIERRKRCAEIRAKIEGGEVAEISGFITLNLNIRQFVQDLLENIADPEFIRYFYQEIKAVTILDPTCGSGAFLFAAMNILEPLYETCIERMEQFAAEEPRKYKFFHEVLAEANSDDHPNLDYFIYKTIILNNLYGVDIMKEAVEIAKLRLFLKMAGAADMNARKPNFGLEPLPDVDFNIRSGNTLVGFASEDDFKKAVQEREPMFAEQTISKFEDEFMITAKAFKDFQDAQLITDKGEDSHRKAKTGLRKRLNTLNEKLNEYLAADYGISKTKQKKKYADWLASHQPFHWFAEFYEIVSGKGGFDVIIGNPPYVEYSKVKKDYAIRGYETERCGNLYAFCMERSDKLLSSVSWFGMIIPSGIFSLDSTTSLRNALLNRFCDNFCSTYAIRPSKLFDGADQRLCIYIGKSGNKASHSIWSTQYYHWNTEERETLFSRLGYSRSFFHTRLNRIPKIGNNEANGALYQLENKSNKMITHYYSPNKQGYLMHYHRSPRYWIRAMDFDQHFVSSTRTKSIHHFRDIYFKDMSEGKAIGAILNSGIFFFWFISVGNGRNITGFDVEQFPVSDFGLFTLEKLVNIFDNLMEDYQKNSFIRIRQNCEFQEFQPNKSKPIIDQIDTMLAQHYGFTQEALDFIINYDIKYRMGKELDAYIDGTLPTAPSENEEEDSE